MTSSGPFLKMPFGSSAMGSSTPFGSSPAFGSSATAGQPFTFPSLAAASASSTAAGSASAAAASGGPAPSGEKLCLVACSQHVVCRSSHAWGHVKVSLHAACQLSIAWLTSTVTSQSRNPLLRCTVVPAFFCQIFWSSPKDCFIYALLIIFLFLT